MAIPAYHPADIRHSRIAISPTIELVEVAPVDVVCLRHEGPIDSIGLSYRKLFARLAGRMDLSRPPPQIGISVGDPAGPDFIYRAGVIAAPLTELIEGVERLRLEGGLHAGYRLIGPYALITPTFQALFGQWLPQSGFEPLGRPALEFYRTPSDLGERSDSVTDLMIPIREI